MDLKILLTLAFVLAASGCAAPETVEPTQGPQEPVPAEAAPAPAQPLDDGHGTFGWLATVGAPGPGVSTGVVYSNVVRVDVPDGVGRLEVNATWTCASPTCDVTVSLWSPNEDLVKVLTGAADASAQGSGTATVSVEGPGAGTWKILADGDGATAEVAGTVEWALLA